MSEKERLSTGASDMAHSSCRCKLSLTLSKTCSGVGCTLRSHHSDLFAPSTLSLTSSANFSGDETISVHSSSPAQSSMSCNQEVSSSFMNGIEQMYLHCTPTKVSPNVLRSCTPSEWSSSTVGYCGHHNKQDLPVRLATCNQDQLKNEVLDNTPNFDNNKGNRESMTGANLLKRLFKAMLWSSLVFMIIVVGIHCNKTTGTQAECILSNVCKKVNEIPLKTIFKDKYEVLMEMIQTAYIIMWNQTACLLNSTETTQSAITLQMMSHFPAEALVKQDKEVFIYSGVILVVLVVSIALVVRPRQHEEHAEDAASFVQKIMTVLVSHEGDPPQSGNPYLSVEHLRDLLIAPHDRKRLKKAWDAAVRIIEKKEVRGRIKMKTSSGGTKLLRFSPPTRACQTSDRPSQSLFEPKAAAGATTCIKLQYFFDATTVWGKNWPEVLRRCILETRIDIQMRQFWRCEVSPSEGTIFIKCASEESAAKMHRFLQMWFYGHEYKITYMDFGRYNRMLPAGTI